MKTVSLVLLAILIALHPFRATSADIAAAGNEFVALLASNDFARAVARYDKTMATALPEPKLRDTWQAVQKQVGTFNKRLQTRVSKIGGFDIALVTCQFDHARLDVKVVFNAESQVAGLFFLPSAAQADSTKPPTYARTNEFREKDFIVGAGEWRLPGTLTLPLTKNSNPLPAIVLVHGSGPNDRDESVGAIKPFRDLAWGLATKGVAVLRYEKRTKEFAAKFIAEKPSITLREETIDDAINAVNQLQKTDRIDPHRIFVLGHSLGGTAAPRIGKAAPQIRGLVIMAGATRPLEDLIVEQTRYILANDGDLSTEDQKKLQDLEATVAQIKKLTPADASSSTILLGAPPAYWLDLREHDPVAEAKSLKQPLLILQGGRDYQVTPTQFDDWKKGLEGAPNVTFKLYPDLNHLFVAGKGKSTPQEYEQSGHVAAEVVADIADWVLKTR